MEVTTLINDKVGHFLIFLLMGVWALFGWQGTRHGPVLIGFLAVYGFTIECVQGYVPGRYFSLLDWSADILGLIIAVWLIKLNLRTGNSYI